MGSTSKTLALAILAAASTAGQAGASTTARAPAPLAVDQELRGEITSDDPLNWADGSRSELYSIGLAADQVVRVSVAGPLRARLSVFLDGQLVQASPAGEERPSLALRAARAGRYVVAVSGSDASAYGPFTVSAVALQAYGGGELTPGAVITDWVQGSRRIPLRIAREGVYVIAMSSTAFDTVLALEGEGVRLSSDDADGSDSLITARLAPGLYTLVASGFQGSADGQYELSVAERELPPGVVPAADGELLPDTAITALYQGQPVRYRLRVPARQLLVLDMASADIDSRLSLAGHGLELSDDDSGERLDARIVSVLDPGEYTVGAASFDGGAGVFTLTARLSDVPGDAGGGPLQAGQSREVRLLQGATDRYALRLARAGTYVIGMASSDGVDSHLRLLRDGRAVAEDDDGGGGLDARIEQQLQAGDYILEASSAVGGEGGRYRIGVQRR